MARKRVEVDRTRRYQVIASNGQQPIIGLRPDEKVTKENGARIIEVPGWREAREKLQALQTLNPGLDFSARSITIEIRPIYIPTS